MVRSIIKEVVLAIMRIGHSGVIHSYMLLDEEQPQCVSCNAAFTVHHILLECVDFSQIRNKYYQVNTMKQLFQDISIGNIMMF